ncbi:hypothetical protein [Methanosarcina siciliae]|uniref:hypothetical protein n=1 Tax=Methanosarcina siciliae TaxID=38027 RepID=UPI00064F5A42|nr:hypothetical protein [Methanosarcina siciliae]
MKGLIESYGFSHEIERYFGLSLKTSGLTSIDIRPEFSPQLSPEIWQISKMNSQNQIYQTI